MNVEQIQKINNLAQNLVQQGLATDRDEALMQAEKILKNQGQEYTELRQNLEEVNTKPEVIEEPELSQEQIKDILQQNSQFLVKKIKEFSEKITLLEQEIQFLKNRPVVVKQVVSESSSAPASASEEGEKKKEGGDHPRSGGYNDDDVSIEKFFYAGKK